MATRAKKAVPDGYQTVTTVLTLEGCKAAIDWYVEALGAERLGVSTTPQGEVIHAEIKIGNSHVMVHDAMMGSKGPRALGGSPAGMWVYVEDCDALYARAMAAGAKQHMAMADQFWGDRCGAFVDPYGYVWTIASHKEDVTPAELTERQNTFFAKMAGKG